VQSSETLIDTAQIGQQVDRYMTIRGDKAQLTREESGAT
jgi:hypothetical protein